MGTENWRTDVTALDYFGQQKKKLDVADRRPVIRKSADLVGPGIGASAVHLDDYNDVLATFNGYYSSEPGAAGAPNATEAFVGIVISDATLGGRQVFTGLTSGIEYSRTFTRSLEDPESVGWGPWSGARIPSTARGMDRSATFCQPGVPTVLTPPPFIQTIGEPNVYERTDGGVRVRKQGVYTGTVQVGDYVGGATNVDIYLYQPMGGSTEFVGRLAQNLVPTVDIPFTVWASDDAQGFSVTAVLSSGAATSLDLWWRFSCTRVGDAV